MFEWSWVSFIVGAVISGVVGLFVGARNSKRLNAIRREAEAKLRAEIEELKTKVK